MEHVNVYRINVESAEKSVSLDLGRCIDPEEKAEKVPAERVERKFHAKIPMWLLKDIVSGLISAGIQYQNETGDDIGFPDFSSGVE